MDALQFNMQHSSFDHGNWNGLFGWSRAHVDNVINVLTKK